MDAVLERYYGGREDEFWKRSDRWPGRYAGTKMENGLNTGD
jgi:hypothetical protein